MSDFPLASKARIAAAAGWTTLIGILALEVVGPILVAGQRVSGSFDAAAIARHYAQPGLLTLEWLQFLILPFAVLFAHALRESLAHDGRSRFLATFALLCVLVEVPVLLFHTALTIVVSDLALRGTEALALFRLWDVSYNGGLYLFETGWVVAFSLAMRGRAGFPRWAPLFGLVVGGLQAFNAFGLVLGVPDVATMPGNIALMGWFVVTNLSLLRLARSAEARPSETVVRVLPSPAGKP